MSNRSRVCGRLLFAQPVRPEQFGVLVDEASGDAEDASELGSVDQPGRPGLLLEQFGQVGLEARSEQVGDALGEGLDGRASPLRSSRRLLAELGGQAVVFGLCVVGTRLVLGSGRRYRVRFRVSP